ncbi:MAG TPA: hypothetical protein VNZ52_03460 [Candidatus Thermoplasmatota archaeon]|nr:hypothetical protein [Candidatus Thermoplasmatota archaeon]
MFKKLVFAAALAALVALATPVNADPAFSTSGSFLLGSPVDYFALDACGAPEFEGISSNCVALPAGLDGMAVSFEASDALGSVVDYALCYYDADGSFLACDNEAVASGAAFVGIATIGGVEVQWTLAIG